jgi:hypothetical protein
MSRDWNAGKNRRRRSVMFNDKQLRVLLGEMARRKIQMVCSAFYMLAKEYQRQLRLAQAAPDLLAALRGILEIGKRDMSNPKYDGYFAVAREAVAKAEGESPLGGKE